MNAAEPMISYSILVDYKLILSSMRFVGTAVFEHLKAVE
jgi:hypothetical protein